MIHNKQTTIILLLFAVSIFLCTLFFGLKPKGYRFVNQVECLEKESCLYFYNIGMVYSGNPLGAIGITNSFGLRIDVLPRRLSHRLSRICSISDSKGNKLFTIDQWISGIEVSLFDIKGNRLKRIGKTGVLSVDSITSIYTAVERDTLYLLFNGASEGILKKPVQYPVQYFKDSYLILGFSATGTNPWRGKITSFNLYKKAVHKYSPSPDYLNLKEPPDTFDPVATFSFDQCNNQIITDQSGHNWNLIKPITPKLFRHIAFEIFPQYMTHYKSFIIDMVVNFLGFFPFGGICCLLLLYFFPTVKKNLLTVFCLSLLVSIGIETVQVFIPTRASQLIDVLLNTFGGWCGAKTMLLFLKKIKTYCTLN